MLTPTAGVASGNISLALRANAVTDTAGNANAASTKNSQALDTVAPSTPTISAITADNIINASEKTAGVAVSGTADSTSSTVSVTAKDAAGNTSAAGTRTVAIDTTAPTPSISLNAVTTDNVINAAEAGGNVAITGSTSGTQTRWYSHPEY